MNYRGFIRNGVKVFPDADGFKKVATGELLHKAKCSFSQTTEFPKKHVMELLAIKGLVTSDDAAISFTEIAPGKFASWEGEIPYGE